MNFLIPSITYENFETRIIKNKKIEKRILSYFLNFNAIFTARPHEPMVSRTWNTPLVSICGICSKETFPWWTIAATIGKASKPSTPSFLLFSEICCWTFMVLMFINHFDVVDLYRMGLTFWGHFVQKVNCPINMTVQNWNYRA